MAFVFWHWSHRDYAGESLSRLQKRALQDFPIAAEALLEFLRSLAPPQYGLGLRESRNADRRMLN